MFPTGSFISAPICAIFPLLVKNNVTTESAKDVDDIRHRAMKVIPSRGRGAVEAWYASWVGVWRSLRGDVRGRGEAAARERSFPTSLLVSRNHQGENCLCCEGVVAQPSPKNPQNNRSVGCSDMLLAIAAWICIHRRRLRASMAAVAAHSCEVNPYCWCPHFY